MPVVVINIDMGVIDQKILVLHDQGQDEYMVPIFEIISKVKELGVKNVQIAGNLDFIEPIVDELVEAGFIVKVIRR